MSTASSTTSVPCKQCPKLLDMERKLLNDNKGCVKCRKFFVDHRAVNCPNDFSNPIRYKTLTQGNVDHAKRPRGKVAAVSASNTSTLPTSVLSNETTVHPVAAVLGMSCNPVTYVTPNASSILEVTSDSDMSSSSFVSSLALLIPAVTTTPLKEAVPIHIPHLYWKCLVSGKDFPIVFDALIDHGSSMVLISEEFIAKFGLCHKRLPEPYSAELAMENNGQKINIHFSKYVKIKLHDPSLYWSSKSVRTIIAPGLCAPMILGLPFLTHNDIIVDASTRTVIDKKCNFDLLHLVPPTPPPPPKQKL